MAKELPYRVVAFEGEAKVTLAGEARVVTPEGEILSYIDLKTVPPMLCPLFQSIDVKEGQTVSVKFHIDINLPLIGESSSS